MDQMVFGAVLVEEALDLSFGFVEQTAACVDLVAE